MPSYIENIQKTKSVELLLGKVDSKDKNDEHWKELVEDKFSQLWSYLPYFDCEKIGNLRIALATTHGLNLHDKDTPKLRTLEVEMTSEGELQNPLGLQGLFFPVWRSDNYFWGVTKDRCGMMGQVEFRPNTGKISYVHINYPVSFETINQFTGVSYKEIWESLNSIVQDHFEARERAYKRAKRIKDQSEFEFELAKMKGIL